MVNPEFGNALHVISWMQSRAGEGKGMKPGILLSNTKLNLKTNPKCIFPCPLRNAVGLNSP